LDGLRINTSIEDSRIEAIIGGRKLFLKKGQEIVVGKLGERGRLRKVP
jgi:hypothetical protein